ncbi:MAG: response regulator transcription factor [Acidiferrobacterales bacterium]
MHDEPTVFVVDDDEGMRKSVRWLIESAGLNVETYPSAKDFLDAYDPSRPGCLVLDVRMSDLSGLELQEKLAAKEITLPIIFITAHGSVAAAVRAMRGGAIDYIVKPFDHEALLGRIEHCVKRDREIRRERAWRAEVVTRFALLTAREREVMERVIAGKPNKVIAAELNLSHKTVEAHRARVMEKMQAGSVADLIRMALARGGEGTKGIP